MYVEATNLFIKAQNHSLNSLKNSIIHFFFQRDVHAKRSFCWPKATNVLRYKCCKAANVLSSRVIEPYFIYTVGLRGWRDCDDRCYTVSENTWFLERCCSLHQLWKNICTLGNWDFFFLVCAGMKTSIKLKTVHVWYKYTDQKREVERCFFLFCFVCFFFCNKERINVTCMFAA